jgi:hypothetical protein
VVSTASPLLWSNVHAWGMGRWSDGAFYWVMSAMTAAQLLLSRRLPADIDE